MLPRIQGLETVKKWQRSFFYMKSAEGHDALNLPEFSLSPPVAELNFKYLPAETDELHIIDNVLGTLLERDFDSDDMLRAFVVHRVGPLQMREHKLCHMGNHPDPMRTNRHELSMADVQRWVKAIASFDMEEKWTWKVKPYYRDCLALQVI